MSRHRFIATRTAALIALLGAIMLTVAGCASGDGGGDGAGSAGGGTETTAGGGGDEYGSPSDTTAAGGAGGAGDATLTAQGGAWTETSLSLAKDTTTLKVVNSDSGIHSFTAEQLDVDQDIEGGQEADVSIDLSNASGSVPFKCKYHPSMTGTIEVTS